MKKLIFVSFQTIKNNIPTGMVKYIYYIFLEFNKYSYNKTYYLSYSDSTNSQIKSVSIIYRYINKILALINIYFKIWHSGEIRFLQEKIFDFLLSFKLKNQDVLISSAYIPSTLKKCNNLKIFLAGNPDDYEIYNIMHEEMSKYKIKLNDAYTNINRITFISDTILQYDHIICFTIVQYESFLKRISKDKVSLCETFIIPDERIFENKIINKNKELTFCYIANPFWLKGLHYLLEAWESIEDAECKLIIGGRLDQQLTDYIANNFNHLKRVEFTGWIDDINTFYRSSHVCIIPSILDAGPTTVAEAMYCELPVIATEGCGSKTLIENGQNGFIVPSRNSIALADKINWFINNRDKIREMGINAAKKIQTLKDENQYIKVTEHIIKIINSLSKGMKI